MNEKRWFSCLAEVQGLKYQNNPNIKREQLPGYNTIAYTKIDTDYNSSQMVWVEKNGTEKWQSPAREWQNANQKPQKDETPLGLLKTLYEILELPGELSDYHNAILNCAYELSKYKWKEPWVLKEREKLCWLDIQIVEIYADTIYFDDDVCKGTAFQCLIEIYEREGYLYEAMELAQRATRFEPPPQTLKRIQAKLTQLQAEENVNI